MSDKRDVTKETTPLNFIGIYIARVILYGAYVMGVTQDELVDFGITNEMIGSAERYTEILRRRW